MQKKPFGIFIFLMLVLIGACKKSKQKPSNGSGEQKIYVVGSVDNASGKNVPTLWINGVAQHLSTNEGDAYDLFVDGNDVYITGYELMGTNSDRIAKVWKNGIPQTLPASTAYASGEQIYVTKGNVYVLGFEDFNYKTALWINGVKQSVQLPAHPYNSGNQNVGLVVSGNDVYTCGVLKNGAGVEKVVLLRNGAKMGVDTSLNLRSAGQRLFAVGNDIYMVGDESSSPQINTPARLWKNGARQSLEGITRGSANECYVEGKNVYVLGEDWSQSPGRIDLVVWKNGLIHQRIGGPGVVLTGKGITAVNGDVYVCGHELVPSTGMVIAKIWKNGTAQNLSNGTDNISISDFVIQ